MAAEDPPPPFYAVIFHTERAADGQVARFDVESVIDPRSGSTDPVVVPVPEGFIAAARTAFEAHWRASPPPDGGRPYTYAYYDPAEPTRGDIGLDGGGVRFPFTLRLRVDETHASLWHLHATRYVQQGVATLLPGDTLGVRIGDDGRFRYERDPDRADVVFDFWQAADGNTPTEMRLLIANHTTRRLPLVARMVVPGHDGVHDTEVLPVDAGQTGRERWPHPIAQLLLELPADGRVPHP